MILWYDILLAILFAWIMLNLFFAPFVGPIMAYFAYEGWMAYCNYRLTNQV